MPTATRSSNHRGRTYELPDGVKYPSVTTILGVIGKPALINWAASVEREYCLETAANLYQDVHNTPLMSRPAFITTMLQRLGKEKQNKKLLDKAGEIGSQIHKLIEWHLQTMLLQQPGPSPHASDKAMIGFMAFQEWAKGVDLRPIHVEQVVWSRTHGYAGTMDLYALVNGIETVVDFKSGKKVYPEAHLQVASYMHAFREMGHGDPKQGIIVRLPKGEADPGFEAVPAWDEGECFLQFNAAQRLWAWLQSKDEYLKSKDEEN